jgi:hypothetical protein
MDPTPFTNPVAVPAARFVPKSIEAVAEMSESGPNKNAPTAKKNALISQMF